MAAPETKVLILQKALRLASRTGLEGLTIGELAKSVGMSKSGLFAHFQNKESLQVETLRAAAEHFVETVMRPAFRAPRGESRLLALFENWLAHLNDAGAPPSGAVLIAASAEFDDRPGPAREYIKGAQLDLIRNVERAARIAVEAGNFRADLDVELFAWSLYSFILGYHHFKKMLEDPKADEHARRSFHALLDVARAGGGAAKMHIETDDKMNRKSS